jgi:hypothetical protein
MSIVVLVLVLLLVFGGLPQLGFHSYGWGPSGVGVILLIILLVLLIGGRL